MLFKNILIFLSILALPCLVHSKEYTTDLNLVLKQVNQLVPEAQCKIEQGGQRIICLNGYMPVSWDSHNRYTFIYPVLEVKSRHVADVWTIITNTTKSKPAKRGQFQSELMLVRFDCANKTMKLRQAMKLSGRYALGDYLGQDPGVHQPPTPCCAPGTSIREVQRYVEAYLRIAYQQ